MLTKLSNTASIIGKDIKNFMKIFSGEPSPMKLQLMNQIGGNNLYIIKLTQLWLTAAVIVILGVTAAITANSIFEPTVNSTTTTVNVIPNKR